MICLHKLSSRWVFRPFWYHLSQSSFISRWSRDNIKKAQQLIESIYKFTAWPNSGIFTSRESCVNSALRVEAKDERFFGVKHEKLLMRLLALTLDRFLRLQCFVLVCCSMNNWAFNGTISNCNIQSLILGVECATNKTLFWYKKQLKVLKYEIESLRL